MKLKRKLSSRQDYCLRTVAGGCPVFRINDCTYAYETNEGPISYWVRGLKRTFVAKAYKDLLQRGLLVAGEDGKLELAGEAIREYGHLRQAKKTKRIIPMHRTRPRRAADERVG